MKTKSTESVIHDWISELPFQQQALLMTGMRGPDNSSKHNIAKFIIRYLRCVVLKPAGNWNQTNNNNFMWGEWQLFEGYTNDFWDSHDEYPHHFIMHLIHCAEVIAYKHPVIGMRILWHNFYIQACDSMHMQAETEKAFDNRLNDFGFKPEN